ncbi:nucleobase-ascorbate transporter 1 isoform X4 [Vigna angularis]|uniref:nucleobase-ascorbate transporter 1 isoform X4 n=1 Tax=Phaseolus angularis TaxID=3914 RepID=UPI0022B2DD27|nr:nucleobase-ascorbate transporter 1 isoform X4 [Vigna angularis]
MADITHPPMEQLQDLEYCIDSNPPWVETILLAFQNYILMLGTSVMIPSMLVPAMGGSSGDKAQVIQTLLFVAGINTLLQALFGTRLPAVVGGSFAYVIPIAYIISDSSLQRINDPHERFLQTMRAIQGALIVASSIQIVLGYSQIWGLFSRFFSPLGMAPVVGLVGLGFIQRGFPALGNCVEIGIPMLLLIVGLSQYLKHVRLYRDIPIFERFPVLICVTIVWIYSVILTASGAYRHKATITQNSCRTDRANLISTAPWFMLPYPLQWGPPTFSAGHSFAMMSAVIVSMVESTGAYKAASRLAIATPPPAYVLSRGIGWQGKCGTPWSNPCWKSQSCSNFSWFYDIFLYFRKVWSCVCIHSLPDICCNILCCVWPCCCSWHIISSVHKHELYEKPYYHRAHTVPRNIRPSFFQSILDQFTPRSCSY